MSGIIWDVAAEYDVPVVVSKGFTSLTQLHASFENIRDAAQASKPSFIYQFGDHDPSGLLIPSSITSRLDEFCIRSDCPSPTVDRIALPPEQIRRYRLPTRPTKRTGNSHAAQFKGRSTELDALPPNVLRSLVRECIERHIEPAHVDASTRRRGIRTRHHRGACARRSKDGGSVNARSQQIVGVPLFDKVTS